MTLPIADARVLARRSDRTRRLPFGVWLSYAFLVLLVVVAITAPWIAPFGVNDQQLADRLEGPFSHSVDGSLHVMGTDQLGRDLLTLMIYGARLSMAVGAATVFLSGVIGCLVGITAGYFGGAVRSVLMRVVDVMLAFPVLLLALLILFAIGPSFWSIVLVLAFGRWPVFARVGESLVLGIRDEPYLAAARTIGCRAPRILVRHVLPNVAPPLLVLAALEVAVVIPTEASLSFLGVGIQPPSTSWGLIVADGRAYMASAWWTVTFPALAILLTTLSLNWVASRAKGKP